LPDVPTGFWGGLSIALGAVVGSFLNVVVWRLPRGESLVYPGSHCPKCQSPLSAVDNIPLVSFLMLGGRCRTCRAPISWRYPSVELLTACVFFLLTLRLGPSADAVGYCLFFAALIAALVIDLELFLIPDELNAFALLTAVGLDVWGIATGDPAHALLWGWLPRSILGAAVCTALFIGIQLLGYLLFRKEAMGDGDVKLARAIGALLPLRQALVSFLLAIAIGAVVGVSKLLWLRVRDGAPEPVEEPAGEAEEPEGIGLGALASGGLQYLLWFDLGALLVEKLTKRRSAVALMDEEDDFEAGPMHLPFGPFLVAGALLAVFVGDALLRWYLAWARLAPPAGG
jgi:leader peptidase (prepilin peptidase)/N-methyltransferase